MPLHRTARIRRRVFAFAAILSAAAFIAAGCCFIRAWRVSDDWGIASWNPSSRTFTVTRVILARDRVFAHRESTTALPGDSVAHLAPAAGPPYRRVVHLVGPGRAIPSGPWLWADHYRSTPTVGINRSGLSDCWTLEFRLETALIAFALVPAVWTIVALRRWQKTRALNARGFAVVTPKVAEASAGGTAGA